MRSLWLAVSLAVTLFASACSKDEQAAAPPPQTMTADATGYYCGMLLGEHTGPKGQILLSSGAKPVWFTSVRDTFAFLDLPEEPKDVVAVYVSDMGAAASWEQPGADNWIAADGAFFVIDSDREGGMGGSEAVPFGKEDSAAAFVAEHGGRVVGFADAKAALATSTPQ
jgi:copper chaperone NosL